MLDESTASIRAVPFWAYLAAGVIMICCTTQAFAVDPAAEMEKSYAKVKEGYDTYSAIQFAALNAIKNAESQIAVNERKVQQITNEMNTIDLSTTRDPEVIVCLEHRGCNWRSVFLRRISVIEQDSNTQRLAIARQKSIIQENTPLFEAHRDALQSITESRAQFEKTKNLGTATATPGTAEALFQKESLDTERKTLELRESVPPQYVPKTQGGRW